MNFDLNLGSNLDTPSFFETAAQERIVPTMLAAFEHSLTVMAARHPGLLLRVHNRRDEAFFLLLFIVERQCLATCDGSLSETLFGLIRTAAGGGEMPRHKARYSLFFLVLLPYIQRKLERIAAPSIQAGTAEQVHPHALLNRNSWIIFQMQACDSTHEQPPLTSIPRALHTQEVAREGDNTAAEAEPDRGFHLPEEARGWAHLSAAPSMPAAPSPGGAGGAIMAAGAAGDWREWVRRVYPWAHAVKEGSVLAFHVLYLFDRTKFSRHIAPLPPRLRALAVVLAVSEPDLPPAPRHSLPLPGLEFEKQLCQVVHSSSHPAL